MAGAKQTKLMQQHAAAKALYPDALLFFRLGDFYEMFGEDAVEGARVLDIALTSRNKGAPDEIPMAGVPHHAAHSYIGKLLQAGYRVALCEQMADPKLTKGIVPRDVVRVLTPGLVSDDQHLVAGRNNWLAAITVALGSVGIALYDLSTGELRQAALDGMSSLLSELVREAPREILVGGTSESDVGAAIAALRVVIPAASIVADAPLLEPDQSRVERLLGAEAEHAAPAARDALARALRHAERCLPDRALPSLVLGRWDPSEALRIDENAQRHLELVESNSKNPRATLLGVLDETRMAAGARLLRRRLLAPLASVEPIRRRHDRVQAFLHHAAVRSEFQKHLESVCDFERIVSRCQLGEGSPRDLGQLRTGLLAAGRALDLLESLNEPMAREALELGSPDALPELCSELDGALVERPPTNRDGRVFRSGYDAELDDLDRVRTEGSALIAELETELRKQTGMNGLRVRFTRVFGWYVEVGRALAKKVPSTWRRKQTVATGERYTFDQLDELAERIATADDRYRAREDVLLGELLQRVIDAGERLRSLSRRLASWDVDAALAEIAHRYDYTRPVVVEGTELCIVEGRHPVVERLAAAGRFVPNDVNLDGEGERLWIITGPNMAGKSTYLRQVALIAILAQMGSFVPAKHAHIGVCDRVLSRVGASDNLAEGQSTFMVEMKETADILRYATPRSLVILDEIGRGTSTFDGLAIAWAVAEHLDQVCRCRALFATHYHELTRLAEESEHVANQSVSARERDGDVLFLHRVVPGAASRSYGVSVAKLAGLPEAVLARARALLAMLEGEAVVANEPIARGKPKRGRSDGQLGLFGEGKQQVVTSEHEVLATLRGVDVDRLTPLEALQLIVKLKKRL